MTSQQQFIDALRYDVQITGDGKESGIARYYRLNKKLIKIVRDLYTEYYYTIEVDGTYGVKTVQYDSLTFYQVNGVDVTREVFERMDWDKYEYN